MVCNLITCCSVTHSIWTTRGMKCPERLKSISSARLLERGLYLPEIAKICQIAGSRGLTYVGDCKMAALGTCVEIVAYGDDSLCPLSAKQMPEAARARVRAPIWSGALAPS